MSDILGRAPDVVQRWLLDTKDSRKDLSQLAKELRQHDKAAKDAATVQTALAKQMGGTETATKGAGKEVHKLGATMTAAGVAANIATGLLNKLSSALKWGARTALEYEDKIKGNEAAVTALRTATGGLVGSLALVRAQNRLTTGDFQMTEEQVSAVAKAAVVAGRNLHIDFETALDRISKGIQTGSSRALKELGVNIDLTGTASEKSARAIEAITDRFGGMDVEASNANERIAQLKNKLDDAIGRLGSAVVGSDAFKDAIDGIAKAIDTAIPYLEKFIQGVAQTFKDFKAKEHPLQTLTVGAKLHEDFLEEWAKRGKSARAREYKALLDWQKSLATLGEAPVSVGAAASPVVERAVSAVDITKKTSKGAAGVEMLDPITSLGDSMRAEFDAAAASAQALAPELREIGDILGDIETDFAAKLAAKEGTFPSGGMAGAAAAFRAWQQQTRAMNDAADAAAHYSEVMSEVKTNLTSFVGDTLKSLHDGLWDAIDSIVSGTEAWDAAFGKLVKGALFKLAGWAGWEALMAFGRWASSWFMDAAQGAAFAAYSAVALGAGAGGIAISASSASSASSAAPQSSSAASSQSFGAPVDDGKRTINVAVYFGDRDSPTAALLAKKQIQGTAT